MAKKFNERLQEERAKETQGRKTDGTETAKQKLSKKTKGEYKETNIKLRITVEDKERWIAQANGKPLSAFIRDIVNSYIERGTE